MIIDTHTHIFPDRVADKIIAQLVARPKDVKNYTNGTKTELTAAMKRAGIEYSWTLPIVTKPEQFESINRFAAEINGKDGLISFGSIHPENDQIKEKISYIKSLGLKGIKLHPDYQGAYIDDPRFVEIIRECVAAGLLVVIHAGVDIGYPDRVYCPPVRIAHMLDMVYGKKLPVNPQIILAHIGGHGMYDEVERCLVGRNIYMDLAYSLPDIHKVQLLRIIQDHGADRILFASDSPWTDQEEYLQLFDELPLFDDERELILWKNAAELMNMDV